MAIKRTIQYFLIASVVVAVAIIARIQTSLPFLDQFRLKHKLFSEQWSHLAESVLEMPGFYTVAISDGPDVVAFSHESSSAGSTAGNPRQVSLRADQEQLFGSLLRSSRLYRLQKHPSHLRRIVGDADRFGRVFFVHLVSPSSGYNHYDSCNEQYRRNEEGFCEVALSEDWIMEYQWSPPFE